MKKIGTAFLVAILCLTWCVPVCTAAEGGTELAQRPRASAPGTSAPPPPQQGDARVTHAELAQILVNVLSLARFPNAETAQQQFALLSQNQIAPPGGWVLDKVVTKGDLAVVLVKALRKMGREVDIDVDDTKAAMAWLRQEGIPIDTIGEGTSVVGSLSEPVAPQVFMPSSDPWTRREKFSPTDEQESGADAERAGRGPEVAPLATERAPEEPPPPPPPPRPSGGGQPDQGLTLRQIAIIIGLINLPEPPVTPFRPQS
jgi:hypothetical protein